MATYDTAVFLKRYRYNSPLLGLYKLTSFTLSHWVVAMRVWLCDRQQTDLE